MKFAVPSPVLTATVLASAAAIASLPRNGPVQPTIPLADTGLPNGEAYQLAVFSDAYPPAAELTLRSRGRPVDESFLTMLMAADGSLHGSRIRQDVTIEGVALNALSAGVDNGSSITYYWLARAAGSAAGFICRVRSRAALDESVGEATTWCARKLSDAALK